MGWVDPRVESGWVEIFSFLGGVGWVVGRKKCLKILKLTYYVCNLYRTVCFVNLQFGASLVQLHNVCKIMRLKLSSLCPKVCCWLYEVRLVCGSKVFTLRWVGLG